ncbi:MAG: hypothetical protein COA33_005005 [Fluviicola sp.]|nr:hypothetical protein [Fluviicola sp.]
MFYSVDANSYKLLGEAIVGGTDSGYYSIRPIGFPLILTFLLKIGGVYAVWFYHVALWVLSSVYIFKSIFELTSKVVLAYVGGLIFVINLSLISMTFHGLTELTTVFLLVLLSYTCCKNIKQRRELFFLHSTLLFLSVLTIIKPSFFYPFIFVLVVLLPLFYLKKYINNPKKLFLLILIISPVITQVSVMKLKYDEVTVSQIGAKTFKSYVYAQGLEEIKGLEHKEALTMANQETNSEIKSFFFDNFSTYALLFSDNIMSNIRSEANYLKTSDKNQNEFYNEIMKAMNKVYFILHALFILIFVVVFFYLLKGKKHVKMIVLIGMSALFYYYIFTTGISFYQGDRLVIGVLGVWIIFYMFLLDNLIQLFRKEKTSS